MLERRIIDKLVDSDSVLLRLFDFICNGLEVGDCVIIMFTTVCTTRTATYEWLYGLYCCTMPASTLISTIYQC